MFRDVALGTFDLTSAVGLRTVPGEDVLVRIDGTFKVSPVVPVLLQRVDDVRFIMATMPELQ